MKRIPIFPVVLTAVVAFAWIALSELQVAFSADDAPPADSASAESDSHASPSRDAITLLREARNRLFERTSVRATLQETVSMGDRKFRASGSYVAGIFPKLRLEFDVQVGQTTGKLLEVCDGTLLWTEQSLATEDGKKPTVLVSRTVIDEVLAAVSNSDDNPEALLIAGLGMGGVPALLAALERSMTFEALKTDEADGRKFSIIQGRWNTDYQTRFTVKNEKSLPSYVPDRVRIYIDDETLFPTRILYLKAVPEHPKQYRALLSLEFSDIQLDGPVSEENFRYVPPLNVETRDRTSEFKDLIERANQKSATQDATP